MNCTSFSGRTPFRKAVFTSYWLVRQSLQAAMCRIVRMDARRAVGDVVSV